MAWSSHSFNGRRCYIAQEMFANGILTALKPSLEQDRKLVLRLLRLYGDQALICSNCKLVYSRRYSAFLVKNNTPLCGKFYGYPHHQNRLGHTLKPANQSCETSVILELVPSQGRKLKNSNVNYFLSSCFRFQSELFPKFVLQVEKLVTLLLFRQLPVHLRQKPLISLKICTNRGSSQIFMTIRLYLLK